MSPKTIPLRLAVAALYMAVPFLGHAAKPGVCVNALDTSVAPSTTQAFAKLNLGLTPAQAAFQSERIKGVIRLAGTSAILGDLAGAVRLLADPRVLEGTGFRLGTLRPTLALVEDESLSERSYFRLMTRSLNPRPSVSAQGVVILPLPPRPTFREQRAFIRIAAEELGHVAQLLGERAQPDRRVISRMFNAPGRVDINFLKATDDELFRQENVLIYESDEADVYAFLIEALGSDLVPWWFGKDANYPCRVLVDAKLTKLGVPHRAWAP